MCVSRTFILVCLAALACRPYGTRVSVWAPGPDSLPSPVARLPVVFLPYDRDSILRALEAAGTPRPSEATLDSLLAQTRAPLLAYTHLVWLADSARAAMTTLRATLDTTPRNSDRYRELYTEFASLSDSAPTWDTRAAARQRTLGRTDRRLADAIARARARIERWEDSTYRGYAAATDSIVARTGRRPIRDTTDATGNLVAALPSGRWWLYVRAPDVNDPDGEWYWNAPVRGTALRLDRTNAIHRIRP